MEKPATGEGTRVSAGTWDHLKRLIEDGAALEVVEFVTQFPPQPTTDLVAPLREFERALRDHGGRGRPWQRKSLVLAGAALLPSTLLVARWIGRYAAVHGYASGVPVGQLLVRLLRERPREWLAGLAARLAGQDGIGADQIWLIGAVSRMAGVGLPVTDAFARGWARAGAPQTGPAWDPVLLRTFDAAETGRYLVRWDGNGFAEAVLEAVASGRIGRAEAIDRCVEALGRQRQVGDVRGYLALYARLALTAEEVGEREAALLGLLRARHVQVAALAQSELVRANAAGSIQDGGLLAATRTVFLRRDRGMARAQVAWLGLALKRRPEHAEAARGLVQPWPGPPDEDVLADVRKLAERHLKVPLPAAGQERSAAEPAPRPAGSGRLPSLAGPRRAVPRSGRSFPHDPDRALASAEELAVEIAALLNSPGRQVRAMSLEQVLAGLVAFSFADRTGLRSALEGVGLLRADQKIDWSRRLLAEPDEFAELELAMLAAACSTTRSAPGAPFPEFGSLSPADPWRSKVGQCSGADQDRPGGGPGLLMLRLHEVVAGVVHAPRPLLMATPTRPAGILEPEVLLERVRRAAREGWDPWPHDLRQALARLPAVEAPTVVRQANDLGTRAGAQLSLWLSGNRSQQVLDLLPKIRGRDGGFGRRAEFISCWPSVLPADRELVASNSPRLARSGADGIGRGPALLALAETSGPVGPGIRQALATGLGTSDGTDRTAAVRAVQEFAGQQSLDLGALGAEAAELALACRSMSLANLAGGARELAASAGARPAWEIVAGALRILLEPRSGRPEGLVELARCGADLAGSASPGDPIADVVRVLVADEGGGPAGGGGGGGRRAGRRGG
ncbi:hypothetical protein ACFXPA_29130, partial [Amycolatopsis sp. NPDC059090]|uniref:hypothetical protein n=1 Tax=Amycolatopsis sp. NPDC059090 TaxID=3346723 RepID=UPI00366D7C24